MGLSFAVLPFRERQRKSADRFPNVSGAYTSLANGKHLFIRIHPSHMNFITLDELELVTTIDTSQERQKTGGLELPIIYIVPPQAAYL